ncbi:unnamed protein product [Euphydryas editha]|uniref:BED-type domain-containing protein n=1 Tax=Euphydryas editha TaxID=104508 RepID=A0AAU9TRE9_EUPED|nr:unnamed protein product [Euphydryas editha]
MGRKRKNLIYTYFDYNENNKTSKCLIENCEQVLRGNHGANLMRHFYTQHRRLHDQILQENNKNKENVSPHKHDNHIKVMKHCCQLVTIHGRPFSILEDNAFKNLLSLIPNSSPLSVNIKNVKTMIQEHAYDIRK